MKASQFAEALHLDYRRRLLITVGALCLAALADFALWSLGELTLKVCWTLLAGEITIGGYSFYVGQMSPPPGEIAIKPVPLTWTMFGILTGTGWFIQFVQGGSFVGSLCLGITAAWCFYIAYRSCRKFGPRYENQDLVPAVMALLILLAGSMFASNPKWAGRFAVIAAIGDFLSYIPSFRLAWIKPREESITNLLFNTAKCAPALAALQSYSFATTAYLLMLIVVNGSFALGIILRRWYLKHYPSVRSSNAQE